MTEYMVNHMINKNKMIFYRKSHSLLLLMFAITSYPFPLFCNYFSTAKRLRYLSLLQENIESVIHKDHDSPSLHFLRLSLMISGVTK